MEDEDLLIEKPINPPKNIVDKSFQKFQNSLNGIHVSPMTKTTNAGSLNFGYNTPLGDSKFDKNLLPDIQLEFSDFEKSLQFNRGEQQNWGNKAINGVGRFSGKFITETFKMPGYLAGLISSPFTEEGFIEDITNNSWINFFEDIDKDVKEALPIYVRESVENGNLLDNISSVDFWASDAADGLGFIASMLVPGAATKMLGIGAKGTKLIGKGVALTSKTQKGLFNSLSGINKAGITSANLDLATSTGLSTFFEAASETSAATKSLRKELELSGKLSEDEINQKVGELGKNIFLSNLAVLLGPNLIVNKTLLGQFKGGASKRLIKDDKLVKGLKEISNKKKSFNLIKDVVLGGAREGFWEEGMQSTVENYFTDLAKTGEKGNIEKFISSYLDTLGTLEGQKAVFLGAIFGGPMGGYSNIKEGKAKFKQESQLLNLMNNKWDFFTNTITDSYKKDEEGNIIYKDGKAVKDLSKIENSIKSQLDGYTASKLLQTAINENDQISYNLLFDNIFSSIVTPYINVDGGMDILKGQLDGLSDIMLQQQQEFEGENITKKDYISNLMNKASKLKNDYNIFNEYISKNIDIKGDSKEINDFISKLGDTFIYNNSLRREINNIIKKLEKDKSSLILDVLNTELNEKEELLSSKLENQINNNINYLKKQDKEILDNLKLIQNSTEQQKAFDNITELKENVEERIIKSEKNIKRVVKKNIEDAKRKEILQRNKEKGKELTKIQVENELIRNNSIDRIFDNYNEEENFVIPESLPNEGEEAVLLKKEIFKNKVSITYNVAGKIKSLTYSKYRTINQETESYNVEGSEFEDTIDYNDKVNKWKTDPNKGRIDVKILGPENEGVSSDWKDYEQNPVDKIGTTVTFDISRDVLNTPKGLKMSKALDILDNKKEHFTSSEIEYLVNYLPLKVKVSDEIFTFLTTLPDTKNINSIQAWEKSEKVIRQQLINNLLEHNNLNNLSSTIKFQYQGLLQLDDRKEGIPENNILNINGIDNKLENIKLANVNSYGNLIYSNGEISSFRVNPEWSGAMFLIVKQANGKEFPLKINIKKVSKEKASIIYDLYETILNNNDLPLNSTLNELNNNIQEKIKEEFKIELDLFKKPFNDIKINDLIDSILYQDTFNIKTRVFINNDTLIFGTNEINKNSLNQDVKDDFIEFISNTKRRQIKFKLKQGDNEDTLTVINPKYLTYLLNNKILNTDAVINEPLFQNNTSIYIDKNINGIIKIKNNPNINHSFINNLEKEIIFNIKEDTDFGGFESKTDKINKYLNIEDKLKIDFAHPNKEGLMKDIKLFFDKIRNSEIKLINTEKKSENKEKFIPSEKIKNTEENIEELQKQKENKENNKGMMNRAEKRAARLKEIDKIKKDCK